MNRETVDMPAVMANAQHNAIALGRPDDEILAPANAESAVADLVFAARRVLQLRTMRGMKSEDFAFAQWEAHHRLETALSRIGGAA